VAFYPERVDEIVEQPHDLRTVLPERREQ
jgi:hypothetical protein